jgi:hypothetical protein
VQTPPDGKWPLNNKKKMRNEPKNPPWRYRKRGFPQKNEPKQTQHRRVPLAACPTLSDNYSRDAMGFSAFLMTCRTPRGFGPNGAKGCSRGWRSSRRAGTNETRGKKGKYHPAPKRAEDGSFFAQVVNKKDEFSDILALPASAQ